MLIITRVIRIECGGTKGTVLPRVCLLDHTQAARATKHNSPLIKSHRPSRRPLRQTPLLKTEFRQRHQSARRLTEALARAADLDPDAR